MTHLPDNILKGFDEGLLTGMILIDLQKRFDTINHKALLQKLKAAKITHKCFNKYMYGWKFNPSSDIADYKNFNHYNKN